MVTKFAYPAIFHKEEKTYWVEFPDLKGCHTEGETIEEAAEMAKDVLEGYIGLFLEQGKPLPAPTKFSDISTDEKTMIVVADINNIKSQTRYVKKTLSIPYWLNSEAEKLHINFSSVLQEALKERLRV